MSTQDDDALDVLLSNWKLDDETMPGSSSPSPATRSSVQSKNKNPQRRPLASPSKSMSKGKNKMSQGPRSTHLCIAKVSIDDELVTFTASEDSDSESCVTFTHLKRPILPSKTTSLEAQASSPEGSNSVSYENRPKPTKSPNTLQMGFLTQQNGAGRGRTVPTQPNSPDSTPTRRNQGPREGRYQRGAIAFLLQRDLSSPSILPTRTPQPVHGDDDIFSPGGGQPTEIVRSLDQRSPLRANATMPNILRRIPTPIRDPVATSRQPLETRLARSGSTSTILSNASPNGAMAHVEAASLTAPLSPASVATSREPLETRLVQSGSISMPPLNTSRNEAMVHVEALSLTTLPPPLPAIPRLGVGLGAIYIAHHRQYQQMMDTRKLCWGIQYEIARGISTGSWVWEDVSPEKLDHLARLGPVNGPMQVEKAILGDDLENLRICNTSQVHRRISIWEELDREQEGIVENQGHGLGLKGDRKGVENWHGGKIQQVGRLVEVPDPLSAGNGSSLKKTPSKSKQRSADKPHRKFSISLGEMEMGRSYRLARFLGSRRVLQIRVPDDLKGNDVQCFFQQKFVICGRVFVPLHAKDGSTYMIETNESWGRSIDEAEGDNLRLSFDEIVDWFNPLNLNYRQPMSKWASRWQLCLSTSIPAIEFEGENIHFIKDKVFGPDPKPKAELVLTDGCGFINGAALTSIARRLKLESRPAAVQGRIAGSKGLWILHPTDRDPTQPPRIWIRDSQRKILLPPFDQLERSHRIFDLVAPARVSAPSSLTKQPLINLAHGGVPHSVFVDLLKESLKEEIEGLSSWDAPPPVLWAAIFRASGLGVKRLKQLACGFERALGIAGRNFGTDGGTTQDVEEVPERSAEAVDSQGQKGATNSSVHESALQLLQAGFHPRDCSILNDKIQKILEIRLNSCIGDYRFALPLSAEAFLAPDPYGVLEEGELFFQSSKALKNPDSEAFFRVFLGEVVLMRYPIDQPYNVRKMRAVYREELVDYFDIIFLSIRGTHSPASELGGGDYDGDVGIITSEKRVTSHFKDSEVSTPPDDFLRENFEVDIIKVNEFLGKKSEDDFHSQLLSGLAETFVGLYGHLHTVSTYKNGYDHKDTKRLGWMFTTHLDAAKTGLRPNQNVLDNDRKKYNGPKPRCLQRVGSRDIPDENETQRGSLLGRFILDTLRDEGKTFIKEHLDNRHKLATNVSTARDEDLCKPFEDAQRRANSAMEAGFQIFRDELHRIMGHVQCIRKDWPDAVAKAKSPEEATSTRNPMDELARRFDAGPLNILCMSPEEVKRVKASYAYLNYHSSRKQDYFAFRMATDSLCAIKSSAKGAFAIERSLGECMAIPASIVRVLTATESKR